MAIGELLKDFQTNPAMIWGAIILTLAISMLGIDANNDRKVTQEEVDHVRMQIVALSVDVSHLSEIGPKQVVEALYLLSRNIEKQRIETSKGIKQQKVLESLLRDIRDAQIRWRVKQDTEKHRGIDSNGNGN